MPRESRKPLLRTLLRILRPIWRNRRVALWTEELFWHRWLRRHPERVAMATDPRSPFPEDLLPFFEHIDGRRVDVLEVGSGLVGLGHWHPTRDIRLVRTDVLADQYNRLLHRRGIQLPVPIVFADAERLVPQFGADSFDLVYATNCLDHMQRPVAALLQMISVTRVSGFVVMWHEIDEGARQDYAGLHQWNLCAEDGHLIIWNDVERHDMTTALADSCDVLAEARGELLYTEIRKRTGAVVSAGG